MNKLALSILACGLPVPRLHRRAPTGVHAAVELRAATRAVPTPTTCTRRSEIDPSGVYEISGYRGTTRFVEITQQQRRIMSWTLP